MARFRKIVGRDASVGIWRATATNGNVYFSLRMMDRLGGRVNEHQTDRYPRKPSWWNKSREGAVTSHRKGNTVDKKSGVSGFGAKLQRPRNFARVALFLALALVCAGRASAQYGGGGTGSGGGSGTPPYVAPKGGYASGAAAGVGAGAGAGVAAIFLAVHYHGRVTGCVQNAGDGLRFVDDKKGVSYTLDSGDVFLKAGQHVQVKGSKAMPAAGVPSFKAKKLIKDLGSCGAAATAEGSSSTSGQ